MSETINNTRNMRFGEILIVRLSGIDIYNTTGVTDCPPEQWNALDVGQIRKEFHALKVENDPEGNANVLQAREERFPIDTLAKLNELLKLPEGWQFRTFDLNEDLILDLNSDQKIYAVGDEFHQYWTRIPRSG
jgi:hypothetical protein